MRPVGSYGILCAIRQPSDPEDMRRVHSVIALALLHDRFQQLRQSDMVAVGDHVRERPISQPGQPHTALWYVA